MNKIEKILEILRGINWTTEPQSADSEDFDGATSYLQMYARFIQKNQQEINQNFTPFSSPFKVLGLHELRVQKKVEDECQELAGQSIFAYDRVFCMRALEWATLCENKHPSTLGGGDMFDPLIRLVVNRIPTRIRQGYWVVDESMYPLLDWVSRYGK